MIYKVNFYISLIIVHSDLHFELIQVLNLLCIFDILSIFFLGHPVYEIWVYTKRKSYMSSEITPRGNHIWALRLHQEEIIYELWDYTKRKSYMSSEITPRGNHIWDLRLHQEEIIYELWDYTKRKSYMSSEITPRGNHIWDLSLHQEEILYELWVYIDIIRNIQRKSYMSSEFRNTEHQDFWPRINFEAQR